MKAVIMAGGFGTSEMDAKIALNATFPHPVFAEIFDYALRKI
jgi:hypothetical protein